MRGYCGFADPGKTAVGTFDGGACRRRVQVSLYCSELHKSTENNINSIHAVEAPVSISWELYGGPEGVRDLGLLESALARPKISSHTLSGKTFP